MTDQPSRTLRVGLSFISGLGLIFMVVSAGVGVINPPTDSSTLSLLFAVGVAMLISGIVAWFLVVRPDTHFDDINVPMYHGHDHHDEHAEGEKALAEHH